MPVSINNTQVVFNDATTQTTAGVTSVGAGTGISSSGGLTPTIANTGVTSIVAGTGISISGGTGAVTITNSQPGAVSSVNGQTGAVVDTSVDSIGSYITTFSAVTLSGSGTNYTVGATLAGSSLRYNPTNTLSTGTWQMTTGSTVGGNVSVAYPGGGTALSGTYRAMNMQNNSRNYCAGDNQTVATWILGLWVRIS